MTAPCQGLYMAGLGSDATENFAASPKSLPTNRGCETSWRNFWQVSNDRNLKAGGRESNFSILRRTFVFRCNVLRKCLQSLTALSLFLRLMLECLEIVLMSISTGCWDLSLWISSCLGSVELCSLQPTTFNLFLSERPLRLTYSLVLKDWLGFGTIPRNRSFSRRPVSYAILKSKVETSPLKAWLTVI
jgi:hypothetical protein